MYSTFFRLTLGALLVFALSLPGMVFAQGDGEALASSQSDAPVTQTQDSSATTLQFTPGQSIGDDEAFLMGPRTTAGIITSYALSGAALGALVGLGGYVISGFDWSPWNIAYFGAGGAVVGGIVGGVVAFTGLADRPLANSVEYLQRDVPKAVQLPVFNLSF